VLVHVHIILCIVITQYVTLTYPATCYVVFYICKLCSSCLWCFYYFHWLCHGL